MSVHQVYAPYNHTLCIVLKCASKEEGCSRPTAKQFPPNQSAPDLAPLIRSSRPFTCLSKFIGIMSPRVCEVAGCRESRFLEHAQFCALRARYPHLIFQFPLLLPECAFNTATYERVYPLNSPRLRWENGSPHTISRISEKEPSDHKARTSKCNEKWKNWRTGSFTGPDFCLNLLLRAKSSRILWARERVQWILIGNRFQHTAISSRRRGIDLWRHFHGVVSSLWRLRFGGSGRIRMTACH